MKHVKHVKYIHPADQYIKHIPDYSTFGQKNYTKDKSTTYTRFILADSRYLSYNKYWPVHSSCVHPKCGCKHLKLSCKTNI